MEEQQVKRMDLLKYHRELKTKIEKFEKLGYQNITERELLSYLIHYRWKNCPRWSTSKKRKDISNVQAWEYFDYRRILAIRSHIKLSDFENLDELF